MKIQNSKFKIKSYSSKLKVIQKIIILTLLAVILHFALCTLALSKADGLHLPKAYAVSLINNDNYIIEIQNIDTVTEKDLPDQTQAQKNSKSTISQSIKQIDKPLSISVSDIFIDFGPLTSGNPVKRAVKLGIVSDSIDYQIQGFENHPLSSNKNPFSASNNQILADTTCDNGSCNEDTEALWINELTFGFGFTCEPIQNCIDFTENDKYKQFADTSRQEKPQAIIASQPQPHSRLTKNTQIIFKANVSANQKPVSLSNTITFIAVPNY